MSKPPGGAAIAPEREWALDAVESVSRTFALTIDILEEPMKSWVCTGYLLCRVADTIEDEPRLSLDRRAQLLDTYEAMLGPDPAVDAETFTAAARESTPADGGAGWTVVEGTGRVVALVRSFDPDAAAAMRETSREMADGMASFLRRYDGEEGLRIRTVEELEEYCWYVAGTVGELFTRLLACREVEWETAPDPAEARAFALLLQLVNIAKDAGDDRRTEDNVYLPGEWLAAEGIDHAAVGHQSTDAVATVVERVAEHAAGYADGARRYLWTVPDDEGNVLESIALPYLLALGTLRELRERPVEAVDGSGVKLDREEVETLRSRMGRGITHEEMDHLAETVRDRPVLDGSDLG